jgi:hypothetical protein
MTSVAKLILLHPMFKVSDAIQLGAHVSFTLLKDTFREYFHLINFPARSFFLIKTSFALQTN